MKEKILAIRKALSKNFNAAPVKYLNGEGRHHFSLELPKVTHRVDFSLDVVDKYSAANFKPLCKKVTLFLRERATGQPRQVLVTDGDVREEDWVEDEQGEPQPASAQR